MNPRIKDVTPNDDYTVNLLFDKGEEKVFKRDDPIRHSYHAGDLPVPDPSNLRKCFDLRSEPLIYETGGILCKPKE